MRRDLELDVVVGVDLAAREVLDGRGVDEDVVLAVVGAADQGRAVISALNTAAHVADLVTLASDADEKAFEGFYTDPENHPGGSRKITVDDGTIGVFRQAWIDGGGGAGEPASYTLPALVKGDRIIARLPASKKLPPTWLTDVNTARRPTSPCRPRTPPRHMQRSRASARSGASSGRTATSGPPVHTSTRTSR